MNFLYIILAAFFGGFGLGYLKFFLLGFLCDRIFTPEDKKWVIQAVGAIITAGPCAVYVVSGPLAAAFRKGRVMFWSAAATAAGMLVGAATGWAGTPWLYVFFAGLVMGIYNPAKNAVIPLEAAYSGRSTEVINATLNIAYLAGLLGGIPSGAWTYDSYPGAGAAAAVMLFVTAGLCGGLCRFEEEGPHLKPFGASVRDLLKESAYLVRKYLIYLLASPIIWGIASAVSLAITAYAEEEKLGGAVACSLMSVYAIAGVAVGNVISAKLTPWRYPAAALSALAMALIMLALPLTTGFLRAALGLWPDAVYWFVVAAAASLGVMFGIATNLIEAEYFSRIYTERKEGTGAALLSAGTAFFPFLLGGIIGISINRGWLSGASQFYWMAGVTLVITALIYNMLLRKKERCASGS